MQQWSDATVQRCSKCNGAMHTFPHALAGGLAEPADALGMEAVPAETTPAARVCVQVRECVCVRV